MQEYLHANEAKPHLEQQENIIIDEMLTTMTQPTAAAITTIKGCGAANYPKLSYTEESWNVLRHAYREVMGTDSSISSDESSGWMIPYEVKDGPKGRGVFATKPIHKGTLVWKIQMHAKFYYESSFRKFLNKISYEQACDILLWAYVEKDPSPRFLRPSKQRGEFRVAVELDDASFTNHGEPTEVNLEDKFLFGGVYSTRNIEAGDELLMDYSTFFHHNALPWFDAMQAIAWKEDSSINAQKLSSATLTTTTTISENFPTINYFNNSSTSVSWDQILPMHVLLMVFCLFTCYIFSLKFRAKLSGR